MIIIFYYEFSNKENEVTEHYSQTVSKEQGKK